MSDSGSDTEPYDAESTLRDKPSNTEVLTRTIQKHNINANIHQDDIVNDEFYWPL